jgi:hypothetical protein
MPEGQACVIGQASNKIMDLGMDVQGVGRLARRAADSPARGGNANRHHCRDCGYEASPCLQMALPVSAGGTHELSVACVAAARTRGRRPMWRWANGPRAGEVLALLLPQPWPPVDETAVRSHTLLHASRGENALYGAVDCRTDALLFVASYPSPLTQIISMLSYHVMLLLV